MADPMEEDLLVLSAEDQAAEIKLLRDASDSFQVGFESLPPQVQISHTRFQQDENFDRFYDELDRFLRNHDLDVFLAQYPDFRHTASKLFGKKYSYLAGPPLSGPSTRAPAVQRAGLFSPESDEEPNSGSEQVGTKEQAGTKEPSPIGNLRIFRTVSSATLHPPHRRTRSRDSAHFPTLRLTGSASSEGAPVSPSPGSSEDIIMQGMDAQEDSGIPSSPGSQRSEDMPDYEILGDLSDMELDSSQQSDSQGSDSSELLRNLLQPKGIDTSGDVNLHDYKGWKIEAPKIMLTRAKHFLADEDVDRTVDWPQKFAELDEYFSYLHENFQGEDWGEDLQEAINMLHTHWIFEQYHYGRPELTLDFPNVWPDQSERLPQIPGTNVTMEAEDPSDDPMGERKLILTKIKSAHDFQYQLPGDILRIYIDAYVSDAQKFWSPQARNPPAAGSEGAEERPELSLNMVKCDNEYYDRCIQGGMKTTSNLLKKKCKFKFSRDDIIQSATGPSQLSVQSLESFAKFRGARRAALEQCLNIFNNAENRLVSSAWDTLMLPPPKVPAKAPGILFTGLEVTDIPKDEARDPFRYTLARNWYVKEDNKWAQWIRPHSIKEVYGERLWRHRDDPIVILPVNYKGPYVEHFMDIEMKRVFDLLQSCEILHQGLQRAQRRAPRDFLADVLKLVESGINNEDTAKLNLNFRDNEYRREDEIDKGPPKKKEPIPESPEPDEPADDPSEDFSYASSSSEEMSEHNSESEEEVPRPKESGGNLMHLRPKEEEWLHFLGGPSINKKLIHEEQASDRLELLFEARVDEMFDDIDPEALFRDTKLVTLDEFLAELNRGAQGPVRRHQFSAQDAIKHAKRLSEKGKLHFGHDKSNEAVVSRPEATFHPEDRVRWLPSDKNHEERSPEMDEIPYERPKKRPRGSDSDAASQPSTDFTISTKVSIDKPVDYGEYTAGMPRLRNIYTWEQCLAKKSKRVDTLAKTQNFLRCLAYRLGATLRQMRKRHRANRRYLTKSKKLENRDFVRSVTKYWLWDAEHLPNDPKHNVNSNNLHWVKQDITPNFEDVMKMADPEANTRPWELDRMSPWESNRPNPLKSIRTNIIREAYENKDMLHPTRVVSSKGADGKPRYVATRPGVWTFAHPDHRPKARQFWDINRWPLHLQSNETQEAIRSSGPRRPSVGRRTPSGSSSPPDSPPSRPGKIVQSSNPRPPSTVPDTQRSPRQEIRPGVWSTHYPKSKTAPERHATQSRTLLGEFPRETTTRHSNLEKTTQSSSLQPPSVGSMAQVQRTQRSARPDIRPGALPQRPNVKAPPEIPTVQTRTLPAEFSREIDIPYSDPDVGRRGFRVGVPQFWAGDTPLQRKVMEDTAREALEPPETQQSIFSILCRRLEPDDPTALPEVDPRIIPKSKPRDPAPESESAGESSEESSHDVEEGPLDGAEEESRELDKPQRMNDEEEEENLYDVTPPLSRPPSAAPTSAPTANPRFPQQAGQSMSSQSLNLRIVNSDSGQSSGRSANGDIDLRRR